MNQTQNSNKDRWALLGIPDHEAVQNVGGRLGASRAPGEIRKVFMKMKGRDGVLESLVDSGDVSGLGQAIDQNHQKAADRVSAIHTEFPLSVVLGGSHDHGFSHLKGIQQAWIAKGFSKPRIGCINIDAHLDVRTALPKITSGSPFYLAVESGVLHPRGLIEFGIQPHCNAPELWQYVESKKIQVVPWNELRNGKAVELFQKSLKKLAPACDVVVISLDLDAAAQAFAPGVSAPQSEGFTASEIIAICEAAGRELKVASLGIFEVNPEHDVDSRTSRLAATAAYHFVAESLKERALKSKKPSGVRLLSRSKAT